VEFFGVGGGREKGHILLRGYPPQKEESLGKMSTPGEKREKETKLLSRV